MVLKSRVNEVRVKNDQFAADKLKREELNCPPSAAVKETKEKDNQLCVENLNAKEL